MPGIILDSTLFLLLSLIGARANSLYGEITFEKVSPAGMISGGIVKFLISLGLMPLNTKTPNQQLF